MRNQHDPAFFRGYAAAQENATVNAKLSQHMTLLGICAMAFYGVMLGMGKLSIEVLPQFAVSAVIFLSSGRIMRRAARVMSEEDTEAQRKTKQEKEQREEPDWQFLTNLMNWMAALMIVGIMAIMLMKPLGLTFEEAFSSSKAQENFYAGSVP